jgi:hypothetical protein
MKLIEAMKKMRVIEKRMARKMGSINAYAALVSSEKPYFESESAQKKEVQSLIQANHDLMEEYLNLKRAVEITNLVTTVTIEGLTESISAFLVIKRKFAQMMVNTYGALNDDAAAQRLRQTPPVEGQRLHVIRLYDEKDKLENMRKWMDIYEAIDAKLEVVNATTDLVEELWAEGPNHVAV